MKSECKLKNGATYKTTYVHLNSYLNAKENIMLMLLQIFTTISSFDGMNF
jgi:hypothetical protein